MKFYTIRTYNPKGEYCGHHCLAITNVQQVEDHKDDHDKADPLEQSDWVDSPAFYRVATSEAKRELASIGLGGLA